MKLLIVDDDLYAREGILESLPLDNLGITKVMEAKDGETALQMARWFHPDVVITDISMPRMDGLSFAKNLQRILPQSRLIFVTAFVELNSLRAAIELSAVAFVEKPIEQGKLIKAVEQAADQIRERQKSTQHTQNLLTFQRQQIATMLNRNDKDIEQVKALLKQVDFPPEGIYQSLALRIATGESDVYQSVESVETICRKEGFPCVVEPREDGLLMAVLALPRNHEMTLAVLLNKLLKAFPKSVIGTGMEVNALERVHQSRKSAKNMVNLSFYDGECRLFPYKPGPRDMQAVYAGAFAEFIRLLSGAGEELAVWTQKFFDRIAEAQVVKIETVQALVYAMLLEIYRQTPGLYGQFHGISKESDIEDYVFAAQHLSILKRYMQDVLKTLPENEDDTTKLAHIVRKAKQYIAIHYLLPELDLNRIASSVNFSPAYLNVLFKQETGMTVKQYLIDYRMQVAKRLLSDKHVRVTEIAQLCGYSNANYFSKAFKEISGMTPGEYREKM